MRKGAEIPQLPYWLKEPILKGGRKFPTARLIMTTTDQELLRHPLGASGSSAGIVPLQVLPVARRQHMLLGIQRTDTVSLM